MKTLIAILFLLIAGSVSAGGVVATTRVAPAVTTAPATDGDSVNPESPESTTPERLTHPLDRSVPHGSMPPPLSSEGSGTAAFDTDADGRISDDEARHMELSPEFPLRR